MEKEFEEWIKKHEESMLIFVDHSQSRHKITFMFGSEDNQFILTYPDSYPSAALYTVSSRIKTLSEWVDEVNARLEKKKAKTGAIGTALEICLEVPITFKSSKHPKHQEKDEDEEADDDGGEFEEYEDPQEETTNTTATGMEYDDGAEDEMFQDSLGFLKLKKKWLQKEMQLRAKRDQERLQMCAAQQQANNTKQQQQKKVSQIFSTAAATGVLTNDLKSLMNGASAHLGITAEPVDDNIYDWAVKLFDFPATTSMGRDMAAIKRLYGYDAVELRIEFALDLYPFYPPTVRVVRPRFVGFMMGRVTSMEILRLTGWDPVKNMTEVLTQIRKLLEEHGRVDVDNSMNDPLQHPTGAYTELEFHLLRLELLCETPARVHAKYPELSPIKHTPSPATAAAATSVTQQQQPSNKKYWAAGTGYGHGDSKAVAWDVNAYLAAQQQKDEETAAIFSKVAAALRADVAQFPADSAIPFDVIEESCLVPVVESYLRNDSLLDMGQHVGLYMVVLDVCKALAGRVQWIPLFESLPNQSKSVLELIQTQYQQAQAIIKTMTTGTTATKEEQEAPAVKLANMIISTYTTIKQQMATQKTSPQTMTTTTASQQTTTVETPEQIYSRAMKELQFDAIKMNLSTHHYTLHRPETMTTTTTAMTTNKAKMMRLAQEQASISVALPLNIDSSIFVRVDEDNMDFMRVLITGPMAADYGRTSTPYAGGCFSFDVYFPANYPQAPPCINLMTTGQGRVRFNPNLYNNGKVCLSLLGTWHGAEGENWNPKTSTLLQVLVSIQSLIMVPMPFFNEPGYEREINTPSGDAKNRQYNEVIRAATIEHAIIGQLRAPTAGFEEIIRRHFYLQQNRILEQCNRWLTEAKSSSAHHSTLSHLIAEMKAEFGKLSFPFPILPA